MQHYDWNEAKNAELKSEHGLGFEDIQAAIEDGRLIVNAPYPNQRDSHQRILVVSIDGYAYVVPFVKDNQKIFLKTIYPSRKFTKKYLRS